MADEHSRMYGLEYPSPELPSGEEQSITLVVALEGYADAGQAVAGAARHLLAALDNRLVASFNLDELIDYRSRRPTTTLDRSSVTDVEDISLELHVLRDTKGTPFLLLTGPEPDLKWNSFIDAVAGLAEKFHVTQTVCLYAAPMTVPHTRPLVVTAHGNSAELVGDAVRFPGQIAVPGAAALQLERHLGRKGKKVAGFTAHVPHYVAASPYPEAMRKLLERVAQAGQLELPLLALSKDEQRVAEQLAEQTADSLEIQQVVGALERQYDEEVAKYRQMGALPESGSAEQIPSSEEIGDEFERFLAALDEGRGGKSEDGKGGEAGPGEPDGGQNEGDGNPEDSGDADGGDDDDQR
ncbi:PAC2 family protein [Corynebacterium otitidis]|uniref:PAC2 family protein n=1 Tax=Corynebacterium otitidis ATCC 51513 TaxID=883169 RepID=I7JVP5_9CORY|nr:PAC2 family protein [Corynebacterium otitidis]EJZ83009.1 hypothetical protein HMPREF9719_00048 [Corynebacterium otitidis ATCC 51513]KKO83956.1 proteasome protein [Corynebacterium otitidis]CCI83176.1 hypothetical protein BN46_0428 [Corynebacterium otitidis ATCC 51513]